MLKTKDEHKKYLIEELDWPEEIAEDLCDFLINKGLLVKE